MQFRLVACSLVSVLAVLAVAARAQTVAWTQRIVSGPSERYYGATAYDAARGLTVFFGGYDFSVHYGDTWEWNGAAWTQRTVSGPSPRYAHAMAYDAARGVSVLFGGVSSAYNGDTWEWNGTVWTRRLVSGPSPRFRPAMAYDTARGVSVLFGGFIEYECNGETWEWNGTGGGAWTQRAVSGPSPRFAHAMVYDSARGVIVLFGGATGACCIAIPNGETWEWNGAAWTQRTVSGPSPRYAHTMAYDAARGVSVLFGGVGNGDYNGETWEWDGIAWTQSAGGGSGGPSPRAGHAMAYDAAREVSVLFGGNINVPVLFGDTWVLGAHCGSADFNHDGDTGTDQDIDAFFACLSGSCCPACDSADFNGDGDVGTDADIESFFRVLAGGSC